MDLMSLYTALDTPTGAHLVTNHGELTLLVVRHEHTNQVCIERYPLGSAIDVTLVSKLIDSIGLSPRDTATSTPAPAAVETTTPARRKPGPKPKPAPAPAAATEICPDCDNSFEPGRSFKTHQRRAKHGAFAPAVISAIPVEPDTVPETEAPAPAIPNRDLCDICGGLWRGHLRCGDCNALMGPGHPSERIAATQGTRPLCDTCARRRRLIPNVSAVAA